MIHSSSNSSFFGYLLENSFTYLYIYCKFCGILFDIKKYLWITFYFLKVFCLTTNLLLLLLLCFCVHVCAGQISGGHKTTLWDLLSLSPLYVLHGFLQLNSGLDVCSMTSIFTCWAISSAFVARFLIHL